MDMRSNMVTVPSEAAFSAALYVQKGKGERLPVPLLGVKSPQQSHAKVKVQTSKGGETGALGLCCLPYNAE
jgi:hypothetical protein